MQTETVRDATASIRRAARNALCAIALAALAPFSCATADGDGTGITPQNTSGTERPSLSAACEIANLAYGAHELQKLDLYLPKDRTDDTPLLVIVHGGGWVAGGKDEASEMAKGLSECTVPVTGAPVTGASGEGPSVSGSGSNKLAVANLDYRLVGKDGVSWKDQIADLGAALEFLADKSGYYTYDGGSIVLLGMSAGGHLSLLYAHKYDSENRVKAVVSLAGPTDVAASDLANSLRANFGFDIAAVFPKADREEASPVNFARNVPTLLMHGELDPVVPFAQAVRLDAALAAEEVPHKFVHFDDTDHSVGGNAQNSAVNRYAEIFAEILAWIGKYA